MTMRSVSELVDMGLDVAVAGGGGAGFGIMSAIALAVAAVGVANADRISEAVARVLFSSGEAVTDEELAALVDRIVTTMPRDVEKPTHWAGLVAWRWCVSRRRARLNAPRVALRATERAQRAAERDIDDAAEAARSDLARSEMRSLILEQLPRVSEATQKGLHYLWGICGEGKTDADMAQRWPGTSRDTRYQWKHRAINALRPHASQTLTRFLR